MRKFFKEVVSTNTNSISYKSTIKKYIIALCISSISSLLLILIFSNTKFKFIIFMSFALILWITISFICRIIKVSKNIGCSIFKSVANLIQTKRISWKIKLQFLYFKQGFILKFLSFIYTLLRLSLLFLIPLLFAYLTFSKSFNELFDNLSEQDVAKLFDISTMIFGIVITLFSILVSIKQRKIYNENEHKMVLKYYIGPYSISTLIFENILYFILVIISYLTGDCNVLSIILLIIYGLFAIICLVSVINSSSVKIYYNVNRLGKNNIFQRRKGNFVSFLRKEDNFTDKISYIIKLSLSTPFIEFFEHIEKLNEKIFYSQNQVEVLDVELFSKYTKEYFKQISNDSQIYGMYIYLNKTKNFLELLYDKKEYQFFEKIVYLVNKQLLNLLSSKTIARRFQTISSRECKISLLDNGLILDIYLRNAMIFLSVAPSIEDFMDFISVKIEKDESKFYTLNKVGYNDVKDKIMKLLNKYESNNESLFNTIKDSVEDLKKLVQIIKEEIDKNKNDY